MMHLRILQLTKMYKIFLILTVCVAIASCSKKTNSSTLAPTTTSASDSVIASGNFVSNAHATSGTIKVYKNTNGRYLAFNNFKTDAGPDLRVYLSKSTNASDFKDLGSLKATNGAFNYTLDSTTNIADYKFVLIWCQDFSVLFGNAQLQ
jgi:Electron transfer DM13